MLQSWREGRSTRFTLVSSFYYSNFRLRARTTRCHLAISRTTSSESSWGRTADNIVPSVQQPLVSNLCLRVEGSYVEPFGDRAWSVSQSARSFSRGATRVLRRRGICFSVCPVFVTILGVASIQLVHTDTFVNRAKLPRQNLARTVCSSISDFAYGDSSR
jgi:hypothetical protein